MRTQEEVKAIIAECEAQNKRMSDKAKEQYKLPYDKRDPDFDSANSVTLSRYNNVTISTLKWLLEEGAPDPTWARLP